MPESLFMSCGTCCVKPRALWNHQFSLTWWTNSNWLDIVGIKQLIGIIHLISCLIFLEFDILILLFAVENFESFQPDPKLVNNNWVERFSLNHEPLAPFVSPTANCGFTVCFWRSVAHGPTKKNANYIRYICILCAHSIYTYIYIHIYIMIVPTNIFSLIHLYWLSYATNQENSTKKQRLQFPLPKNHPGDRRPDPDRVSTAPQVLRLKSFFFLTCKKQGSVNAIHFGGEQAMQIVW